MDKTLATFAFRRRLERKCVILTWRHCSSYRKPCIPVKLAHSVTGGKHESPPILIMHGLFGSYSNWNSLAKALHAQTKRQIFCVDARNHGRSPHTQEMTYHHMAEDLKHFIETYELNNPIVIGHSMGGRAAMLLALTYENLLSKLVAVDISPIGTSPNLLAMKDYFNKLRQIQLPPNTSLSVARSLVDKQLAQTISDVRIRQFLITNLEISQKGMWRVNLPVLENNFENHLARFPSVSSTFNKPTLFIAGNESDYVKDEDYPGIKKLFPNAQFTKIMDAGHWVHADQPFDFLGAVIPFLDS